MNEKMLGIVKRSIDFSPFNRVTSIKIYNFFFGPFLGRICGEVDLSEDEDSIRDLESLVKLMKDKGVSYANTVKLIQNSIDDTAPEIKFTGWEQIVRKKYYQA